MRARDFDRQKFLTETWPEALESGEFRQGTGTLRNEDNDSYCCLGVACELLSRLRLLPRSGDNGWRGMGTLPDKACALLGIMDSGDIAGKADLVELNDGGKSFKQIAKVIRTAAARNQFVPYVDCEAAD